MPHLPDVQDADFPGELDAVADAQRKRYGMVLNPTRQSAYVPHIALGVQALARSFTRSPQLSGRISELLNVRVAAIVGCPF